MYKGAVVQAGTPLFDKKATFEKLADMASEAAFGGADLVVFPEAFVGGYPKGIDFGLRLGSRSDAGRDMFANYYDAAIDGTGDDIDAIAEIARANNVNLVTGIVERDGGTLYCSTAYFSRDGEKLGIHRKLVPTAMERCVWGQGDGSTLLAPEMDMGIVGGAICWENFMPQVRLTMYAKGVEFYCAPTVDDRDVWVPLMQTTALEGRCFVLSAVQYMERSNAPKEAYDAIQGNEPDTVLIRGGSVIVSPMGELLAGPVYGKEAILHAEMDKREIIRGKYDLDIVGHYARPDVFTLQVNEKKQTIKE